MPGGPTAPLAVSGGVAAALALDFSPTVNLGVFLPGVAASYETSMAANVTSTAGDATLSVADPSATATGRLVNGTFSLVQALEARASSASDPGSAFAPITGTNAPLTLLIYPGPVANDQVTIGLRQPIAANESLRTGTYSKTLTFSLSTTTP